MVVLVGREVVGQPEENRPQDLCQSFVTKLRDLDENEGDLLKY